MRGESWERTRGPRWYLYESFYWVHIEPAGDGKSTGYWVGAYNQTLNGPITYTFSKPIGEFSMQLQQIDTAAGHYLLAYNQTVGGTLADSVEFGPRAGTYRSDVKTLRGAGIRRVEVHTPLAGPSSHADYSMLDPVVRPRERGALRIIDSRNRWRWHDPNAPTCFVHVPLTSSYRSTDCSPVKTLCEVSDMRLHRMLAPVLLVASLNAAAAQSSPCLPADSGATVLVTFVNYLLTSSDSGVSTLRQTLGLSNVSPSQVTVVTSGTACTKARDAVDNLASTPNSNRRLYVVKAGNERFFVRDPNATAGEYNPVLLFDSRWVLIRSLLGG